MEDDSSAVLQCPCHQCANTNTLYRALQSKDKTKEVISWLSGSFEQKIRDNGGRLSCDPLSRCVNRVNASFSILNDIRHACRDYLEQSNQQTAGDPKRVTPIKAPVINYETSFPSLSNTTAAAPNVLIARKKPKSKAPLSPQSKPKRRIRPAQASTSNSGNIASLPSEEPLHINSLEASIASLPSESSSQGNITILQEPVMRQIPSSNASAWAKHPPTAQAFNGGNIVSLPSEEPLQPNSLQFSITDLQSTPSQVGGNIASLPSQEPMVRQIPSSNAKAWAKHAPSNSGNIGSLASEAPLQLNALHSSTTGAQVTPSQVGRNIASLPSQEPMMRQRPTNAKAWMKPALNKAEQASNGGNIGSLPSKEPLQLNYLQSSITGAQVTSSQVGGNVASLPSQEPMMRQRPTNAKAWVKPALNKAEQASNDGNIGSLPSEEPLQLNSLQSSITGVQATSSKEIGNIASLRSQEPIQPSSPPKAWTFQTPTTPKRSSGVSNTTDPEQIENLSNLYTTLILYNLVPSTPLELHLLVGLLTLKDSAARKPEKHAIRSILISPEACREFAIHSLTALKTIIGNLHLQVLTAFVDCPSVRELLPALTKELTARLQERHRNIVETDTGFGGGTQPILTLPFDENRDSRHNYKSREESALYKNREESRDAFLYQLRYFQNVRGRVVDISELESSLLKIRRSARIVIQGIQVPNMHWFAQFFSDLLLQLGLVAMEETDKELLRITDKDKLQRLHKRFSSKVGTSKGSSTKMLSDTKEGQSPEKEAHQLFTGHQEFFFIFLQAADSYSFGVHLKSRLASSIKGLERHSELKGLQDRVAKLQLLAKFLGVLLFSPNWHTSGVSSVLNAVSSEEAEIWTSTAELTLPLCQLIDDAHDKQRLLGTIPWILELLRMANWDAISMRSTSVESVVTKLISLRDDIGESQSPSLQLVVLSLESFFHQIVGLRRTHSLSRLQYAGTPSTQEDAVDMVELQVSKNFLFASISHMDELLSLLSSIASTRSKTFGTPRKMRPSSVSASISSFSSLPSAGDAITSVSSLNRTAIPGSRDGESRIIGKLVDLFFHQHGDLKEICEFVTGRAVQKAIAEVQLNFLDAHLGKVEYPRSITEEPSAFTDIEQEALVGSLRFFKDSLGSTIRQSVSTLSPPTKSPKVQEIAAALALTHALRSSNPKVHALVKVEVKKHYEVYLRKEKKRLMDE